MISAVLRSVLTALKSLVPLGFVVLCVLPIVGHLVRWQAADEVLARYPGQTGIMVGGRYDYRQSGSGTDRVESSYAERQYILFPSVVSDPKTIVIAQRNDQPTMVTDRPGGAVVALLGYVLMGVGSWWFWIRPRRRRNLAGPDSLRSQH